MIFTHLFFENNESISVVLHGRHRTDEVDFISSNAHKVFPSASIIKVPIMFYLFDQRFDELDTILHLDDIVEGAGVSPYLSVNALSVNDLITLMIIVSDNRATNTLIEWIGMDELNRYFTSIGLKSTRLQRKMMDTQRRSAGYDNETSAHDMGHLLHLMTEHPHFEAMFTVMKRQLLKDKSLFFYNDESVEYGTKTGDFDDVRHETGIVRYKESIITFTVLSEHHDAEYISYAFHSFGTQLVDYLKSSTLDAPT